MSLIKPGCINKITMRVSKVSVHRLKINYRIAYIRKNWCYFRSLSLSGIEYFPIPFYFSKKEPAFPALVTVPGFGENEYIVGYIWIYQATSDLTIDLLCAGTIRHKDQEIEITIGLRFTSGPASEQYNTSGLRSFKDHSGHMIQ